MAKTGRSIMVKSGGVGLATAAGVAAAVVLVSPYVWYANAMANDGPYFPPPLVALGFLGLPYAVLLLPGLLAAALYEIISRKTLGWLLGAIALANGLLAGSLWYLVMRSSQSDGWLVLMIFGTALIQSGVASGCYWLVNRLGSDWLIGRVSDPRG